MRILFVAPNQEGVRVLDVIPEARAISAKHSVYQLEGKDVTVEKLYSTVDRWKFDAIHFAATMGERGVEMSKDELLTPEDCANVARIAKARICVFSGCNSNAIASYVVNHGAEIAIFSNCELEDADAWKFSLTFYNALENGHSNDLLGAYVVADNGDGLFGWTMNPRLASDALRIAGLSMSRINSRPMAKWQMILVVLLGLLSILLSLVALVR